MIGFKRKFKEQKNIYGKSRSSRYYLYFGCLVFTIVIIMAVFAPFISGYSYSSIDLYNINARPSVEHLLGTDNLGRDILSRLVYGARISLIVGVLASCMQVVIGLVLGLLAGYIGGMVDFVIMRIIDILMCFPFFIVAIAIAAVIGPSLTNLVVIIAILSWTDVARIVRSQVLSLKNRDFVVVSRVIGFSNIEILVKNILPHVLPSVIVAATISMANSILMEAGLSFLGLGIKDPMPSWGNILSSAQNIRSLETYWWTWLPAGICVVSFVLAVNFLGEYLRINLDPLEQGRNRKKTRIENIDIDLRKGRITALVGESGSGKTMTALSIMGLCPEGVDYSGSIKYDGINLLKLSEEDLISRRGKVISMVFQEPMKSLNPLYTVGHQIGEVYRIHTDMTRAQIKENVIELLDQMKLEDPQRVYKLYPHEISGGMRQRVAIAMAMAMNPEILIADEPTTAIDESLKDSIMGLIKDLSRTRNMTVLFISHDINRLKDFADDIVVMYRGLVIESCSCRDFFEGPKERYSRALLRACTGDDFYQIEEEDLPNFRNKDLASLEYKTSMRGDMV